MEARRAAHALGLRGFVRNLSDGSVEVVAEGAPGAIESLIAWCRTGPPYARVDHLDVADQPPTGAERDFEIRF